MIFDLFCSSIQNRQPVREMIDETVQQTQTTEITSLINSSTPLEMFSFEHEAKTFEEYTGQVEDIDVLIVSKLLNLVFF